MIQDIDQVKAADPGWFKDNLPNAYLNTNEVLHHVFEELDHRNKQVFAIAASFDYVFCAALAGAGSVETIDMFSFQHWIGDFKAAAFTLPYDRYLAFMGRPSERYGLKAHTDERIHTGDSGISWFSPRTYRGFRNALGQDEKRFFDRILNSYWMHGHETMPLFASYFIGSLLPADRLAACIPYLATEDTYRRTKDAVRRLPIRNEVGQLEDKVFDKRYDIIYLSNALDFVLTYGGQDKLDATLGKAVSALNPGGTIVLYIRAGEVYETLQNSGLAVKRIHDPSFGWDLITPTAYLCQKP